jgi:hypothetical protein
VKSLVFNAIYFFPEETSLKGKENIVKSLMDSSLKLIPDVFKELKYFS